MQPALDPEVQFKQLMSQLTQVLPYLYIEEFWQLFEQDPPTSTEVPEH